MTAALALVAFALAVGAVLVVRRGWRWLRARLLEALPWLGGGRGESGPTD